MNNRENIVETEEDCLLEQDGSMVVAGIFGDVNSEAIMDRVKRDQMTKNREKYHLVVPCMACSNCLEIRKFKPDGKYYTVGHYCIFGEFMVEAFGTCNQAHMRARGRRRVIYDSTNAPAGFADGLVAIEPKRYYTKRARDKADRDMAKECYRGGSGGYVRPDFDMEAVNSGKIPRGLGN